MKRCEIPGGELTLDKIEALPADLEHLVIWGGAVKNEDLTFLARLPSLKHLVLGEMRVDDGIFQYLRPLKKLEGLNLAYTAIRGDFGQLTALPLRDVRLEGCRFIGDSAAAALAEFPTLRQLEIHMTGVTDAGVAALINLPLEVLWLGPRVTDAAMQALTEMPSLQHLDICAHNISDEGVTALASLPNLQILWLSRCGITDASIPALSTLSHLRELNVNHTGISESGISKLRAALPSCRFPQPD